VLSQHDKTITAKPHDKTTIKDGGEEEKRDTIIIP
jgi:hypothetical protein